MPLYIPKDLPAIDILRNEGTPIDLLELEELTKPVLRIGLLNLMPLKIETETDFIRLLSQSPLTIELKFIRFKSHQSRNTPEEHLNRFYVDFSEIKDQKLDGLIITGAPIEHLPFESVGYWKELQEVFEWSKTHVKSTLNICWAAQAGLYHFHNIQKQSLSNKVFGVFKHQIIQEDVPLLQGILNNFCAPHSRYTEVTTKDILDCPELQLVSASDEVGAFIVMDNQNNQIFITGHTEYPLYRLDGEYKRDLAKNLPIAPPLNYYKENNPQLMPKNTWEEQAILLFTNWLNHYVNK